MIFPFMGSLLAWLCVGTNKNAVKQTAIKQRIAASFFKFMAFINRRNAITMHENDDNSEKAQL
jgi:hypothetical protein